MDLKDKEKEEKEEKKKEQCKICEGTGWVKKGAIICKTCDGIKCIFCKESGLTRMPYDTCDNCFGCGEITK